MLVARAKKSILMPASERGLEHLLWRQTDALTRIACMSGKFPESSVDIFCLLAVQTELNSFLIEITALIFGKKDDQGGDDFLLDKVLDKTGMKGTGNSPPLCCRSWPAQRDGRPGHNIVLHMEWKSCIVGSHKTVHRITYLLPQ